MTAGINSLNILFTLQHYFLVNLIVDLMIGILNLLELAGTS